MLGSEFWNNLSVMRRVKLITEEHWGNCETVNVMALKPTTI